MIKLYIKRTIKLGKIFGAIYFLLSLSVAYGQENMVISPFGFTGNIFRSGIYVIADGEVNATNSYEESVEGKPFAFNYAVSVSAEEGKTKFANSISSIPLLWADDRRIRTRTALGYDAQGTDGSLQGSESVESAACGENAGIGMSAGVVFDLTYGTLGTRSKTENHDYSAEFSTTASGEGMVSTSTSGGSISFIEDDGNYVESSSASYSQGVTAQGNIVSFRQTSKMSASVVGCGLW